MGSRRTPVLLAALFGLGLGLVAPLAAGVPGAESAAPRRRIADLPRTAEAPRGAQAAAGSAAPTFVSVGR